MKSIVRIQNSSGVWFYPLIAIAMLLCTLNDTEKVAEKIYSKLKLRGKKRDFREINSKNKNKIIA